MTTEAALLELFQKAHRQHGGDGNTGVEVWRPKDYAKRFTNSATTKIQHGQGDAALLGKPRGDISQASDTGR
ncbi:hypothetical protein [Geitlerinema calcuttense]|uniref:Uncharacterized protein n=1 Tax=Geitlerinema calcuttense NRMC-F 0142 TaxID=2922238 RepID=A0ABT7LWI5_9CYAN|nr:hypothetical protein [Geitlerinema calcuttense]MDL5055922.1 hypothetical protein [Geitlerinema calcuttense NRMC-F 0142]